VLTESSKPKTAFFIPEGKKRWNGMPTMGATNAHPMFVAMAVASKIEWTNLVIEQDDIDVSTSASKVIVDDILLAAQTVETILILFGQCLQTLQHHWITLQLRKCRFLQTTADCVGFDVLQDGNALAKSKFQAFADLSAPHLFSDICMLIGVFGFYAQALEWFEQRIRRWRSYIKNNTKQGFTDSNTALTVKELWTKEDNDLLDKLKTEIMVHPVLARPDTNKCFY
jgi:hypothetical protein